MSTLNRELTEEQLNQLSLEVKEYAACHGLVMYNRASQLNHAPITLLPTPIPRSSYEKVWDFAPELNVLVHRVSLDHEFLLKHLEGVVEDEFTASLIDIYKKVLEKGIKQKITLGIHRSDYMLHAVDKEEPLLKQVELNTIAASFSNLSCIRADLQRYVLSTQNIQGYSPENVPDNSAREELPASLALAVQLHGAKQGVVVMVVHPNEVNAFDQRWLEYHLWDKHGVRMLRRSLLDFHERSVVDESGRLTIDGHAVSVVYFRAAYTPDDFPTEKEWKGRLIIEESDAIKCPNIAYHLVGTKKIQQVLAVPGVLEKFVSEDTARDLRLLFVGLYSLDEKDESLSQTLQKARENPHDYVLKPQREGGGNNIYGEDIVKSLDTFSAKKLSSFILMDRIRVPEVQTYLMREEKISKVEGVAELGIFSVFVSDAEDKVVYNKAAGFLLRTKVAKVEDGGVAAGVAVLDCPYLV
ncbi:hypothetical protein PROFUN_06559 [Planoprotostelium fungivorum]|uniref:Glutathione synthetase n=1 Tax=Planoprotostelium fungivorum TaxID=1890364 RepID=A0A2P6MRU9_9EUKA|nr:hypothetical protein PROFUN_06559 [Planoprotostelium fungivorum]